MGTDKAGEAARGINQWRFRGWHLFILCSVILYFGPMLQTYPEQDSCSFGSVTNEEYRAMLHEAKKDARIVLKKMRSFKVTQRAHSADQETFKIYFKTQVNKYKTIDEMISAMHASMRAIGGWHVSTYHEFPTRKKPYDYYGLYNYGFKSISVRSNKWIDIFLRYADSNVNIKRQYKSREYYFYQKFPGLAFTTLKHFPRAGREYPKQPCPTVPREDPTADSG